MSCSRAKQLEIGRHATETPHRAASRICSLVLVQVPHHTVASTRFEPFECAATFRSRSLKAGLADSLEGPIG